MQSLGELALAILVSSNKRCFPGEHLVTSGLFRFTSPELENNQDVDLVRCEASYGITCLRLIEYFDQKPCLIYIEMIPLLVEKIRINWFPWDSR